MLMRIAQIASGDFFSTYGGGQVYVKNIVDAMIADGGDVCVVSSVGDVAGVVHKKYKGVDLFEISSPEMLEEALGMVKPDVIHAHSIKREATSIGRKLKIPVVVTSHHGGILCPAGTLLDCEDKICHRKLKHSDCLPCVLRNTRTGLSVWYPFMKRLSEQTYVNIGNWLQGKPFIPFITPVWIAARSIRGKVAEWADIAHDCTLMIAPCRKIADAMVLNGLDEAKVRVIPHGIPLPKERPTFPPVVAGKVKFYYVGRICYVKGIHTLLEAFHSVANPAIELHLIGGAANKQEVRYMSGLKKRYSTDKRIVWHGKIAPEAIYGATRNYHVSSSSSSYVEAFGLNIAEALALGKPVLATRSGGGEAQIKDGVNGWLVPTNDPQAMAEKISWIADNPGQLAKMSRNCHAIAIADHCRELYKIYDEAITR